MSSTAEIEVPARKYCEDCAHCLVSETGAKYARCKLSAEPSGDAMVSRQLAGSDLFYASTTRLSKSKCGPEAQWFEPKPSIAEAAE